MPRSLTRQWNLLACAALFAALAVAAIIWRWEYQFVACLSWLLFWRLLHAFLKRREREETHEDTG